MIQAIAHIIPGIYPARNNAATEVPPDTNEYVIRALLGGISRPLGADAPFYLMSLVLARLHWFCWHGLNLP